MVKKFLYYIFLEEKGWNLKEYLSIRKHIWTLKINEENI